MCRGAYAPLLCILGFGSVRVIDDQSITRLAHTCVDALCLCVRLSARVCACVRVCVCANALTRSHTHLREGLWRFWEAFWREK